MRLSFTDDRVHRGRIINELLMINGRLGDLHLGPGLPPTPAERNQDVESILLHEQEMRISRVYAASKDPAVRARALHDLQRVQTRLKMLYEQGLQDGLPISRL